MFEDGDLEYHVLDVGGQRSERRKWIQCFEDVQVVCFITSLAGFCSVLYEDENENRLVESLKVFKSVATQSCFRNTPFFCWFTKADLFADLASKADMTRTFSDYDGKPGDVDACLAFHKRKFSEILAESSPNKVLRFAQVNCLEGGSVARAFDGLKLFT